MKLTYANVNQTYRVSSIEGGCKARDRLMKLGILPGVLITIKRRAPLKGPFMITINNSNIVIGRGVASKIEVQELS